MNKRKKRETLKPTATLTIHGACELCEGSARRLAKWLRDEAAFLTRNRKNIAKRFTARYYLAQSKVKT